MSRILVIAPDARIADAVRLALDDAVVDAASGVRDAAGGTRGARYDFAFVDTSLLAALSAESDHGDSLRLFRERFPAARVVVMSSADGVREAVNFVREGAAEYLTYPIHPDQVRLVRDSIERREQIRRELSSLPAPSGRLDLLEPIRTNSRLMRDVVKQIRQVAPTRSTVLVTGETGTGKSLIAKIIHAISNRANRQFISVHCGAIPDTLLESELFGHERGAFTGADRRKLGKFEVAHGGTLFLDEVATISPAMQVKLLQVLQDRTIQRLGGEKTIDVDVRIVAASNMDLQAMTHRGDFRDDLFYRLNVFPIEIPPLRDRREDIPTLAEEFLARHNASYQKEIATIHPTVIAAFTAYSWPGNVRELENLMERAVILETSNVLTPDTLPDEVVGPTRRDGPVAVATRESLATVRRRALEEVERAYLRRQLVAHNGRIDATAQAAGITPRQLHKLMIKHGLKKEEFRPQRTPRGTADSAN
jgi:DNA-binding NtrC family response regulator